MALSHICSVYTDPAVEAELRSKGRDLRGYPWGTLEFHDPKQDRNSEAWKTLLDAVDRCAVSGSDEFCPELEIGPALWSQITTLPDSIGKLKAVKKLLLYGSNLVQIPPAIGQMEGLEYLDTYTSYGLHWLPYEIIYCSNLKNFRVSIRALYGNCKYRPPFPELPKVSYLKIPGTSTCSICRRRTRMDQIHQYWVSLLIVKDVVPLLINSCSTDCIASVPVPPKGYIRCPHKGGLKQKQPKPINML